jgi:peptidoglycan/LPS O-acetylase OafA/YrhL
MTMYLINALFVLLVVRQIREHRLDARALAVLVLAVAAAAVMFLHSVPGGGSDIALDLLCGSVGTAMGAVGGLATRLRRGADGRPLGRAGAVAAGM